MQRHDEDTTYVAHCRSVGKRFTSTSADVVALDDVTIGIRAGTFVAIAGPSGSGKSTLLSILGCVDRATSGSVLVEGCDLELLSRRQRRVLRRTSLSMILPQPSDNLFDRLEANENLAWIAKFRGLVDFDPLATLELFGIAGCRTKRVREMSGGEQQRLALACALVGDPLLVLADEPTASLDVANAQLVVAALRAAVDRGATLVAATHDPEVISAADSVVRLAHGHVVDRSTGDGDQHQVGEVNGGAAGRP